jgi:hypothetical protein
MGILADLGAALGVGPANLVAAALAAVNHGSSGSGVKRPQTFYISSSLLFF